MKTSSGSSAVPRRLAIGALRALFLTLAMVFAGACTAPSAERAPDETVGKSSQALVTSFAAGTLIIPMDTTSQDSGTLRAFGLVYQLLLANVPVKWAILPGKAQGGTDFTISAPATVVSRETGTAVAMPVSYRGGPFIIDSADRAAALPIVTAWLASDTVTVVHDLTAGTFSADIERTMAAAPRIAIFEDGNQDIAYGDLNAAGIRDSVGNVWTDASPTTFTEAEIIGPTTTNDADGALFTAGGVPAFCHVTSHHYVATASTPEVVQEFRSFLDYGPTTHTFMECHASETFESNANGHFLTTNGIVDDGNAPNNVTNRFPDDALTQFDGNIDIDTGSVDSIGLAAGSAFRPTVRTLINLQGPTTTSRIVWMSGNMGGDPTNGMVTYLAGHNYTTTVPISANPMTNGVRLFLNSLFETPCTNAAMQPALTFTKSAPAAVTGSTITFTLAYANAGPGVATSAVITDVLPAGTTFVSATGGGTLAGSTVTWNLGSIGAGASGSVSFDVSVAVDGSYSNQATLTYLAGNTSKQLLSNTTATTRTSGGASADLSLTLSDSPDPAQGGSNITYVATVTNSGPAASGTITLTDVLPAGTSFVSATGSGWTCTGTTTITCTSTGLASGASSAVTIVVAAANANATISNTVTVAGAAGDPNAANNTATTTTGVTAVVIADAGPDANSQDTDGDGLTNGVELSLGLNPNDADSDDDGVIDGQEPSFASDTDGDGLINALDADSDNDGLFDGTELGLPCSNPATNLALGRCIPDGDAGATKTNPLVKDTDGGGATDGSEDVNRNGVVDPGERNPTLGNGADDLAGDAGSGDADGDGLSDAFERAIGSNPNDADTDDDGLLDGLEANPAEDTDGDGAINILDVDSDNDGLYDGTELGKNCSNAATDPSKKHCIADADPATTTSPLLKDTDGGGASDGSEDANLDGKVDNGETNPTKGNGADDSKVIDTDKDGLSDALEKFLHSNPNDADSDDDGALDGAEANPADDTDGDGLRNVLDVDSDDDALFDGTELRADCNNPATDKSKNRCIADADTATGTSPLLRDTDGGGASDGSEDPNRNGKVDATEKNPEKGNGADDLTVVDTDKDGLGDLLETAIGSNPNDADSDDDGLLDGLEANPTDDTDGDGKKNVLDADSDGDLLFDGTETGKPCSNPATDATKASCIADADPSTRTALLDPDTDGGGVKDGTEDTNHNGKTDPGERDPLNAADDSLADAGPIPQVDAGAGTDGGPVNAFDDGTLEGGGCACTTTSSSDTTSTAGLTAAAGLLLVLGSRRRRRRA
jgi:uncharacterized repeat protein (TIGR01451 family)/MYXO-CTERM domain-containing protein